MKKHLNQRGFTLIEIIVALLLFTMLLALVWECFIGIFRNYKDLEVKIKLNDQSRLVESFIKEEIRSAEQVTIIVKTETSGAEQKIEPSTDSEARLEGQLRKIILSNVDPYSGTKNSNRSLELQKNPSLKPNEGAYIFCYTANGTSTLIADKISAIKVIRAKDSNNVDFECEFYTSGSNEAYQKLIYLFSESLDYKTSTP